LRSLGSGSDADTATAFLESSLVIVAATGIVAALSVLILSSGITDAGIDATLSALFLSSGIIDAGIDATLSALFLSLSIGGLWLSDFSSKYCVGVTRTLENPEVNEGRESLLFFWN